MSTVATRLGAFLWPTVGALVAVAAVAPPMHAAAEASVAVHMVQHLLLILAAAPLLVLGRPLVQALKMMPVWLRRAAATRARRLRIERSTLRTLAVVAWIAHVLVVWAWHAPRLYDWAITSPAAHAVEHLSLLATACAFWSAVLSARILGAGGAVLYLFAAAGQCTALGALLTLAETPWYPTHVSSASPWGLTPLEDQQLAGLIMWIPGGLVYTAVALAMIARIVRAGPPPVIEERPGAAGA